MITLPVTDAQELYHDLLQSAAETFGPAVPMSNRYRSAARALRSCPGSSEYVELTPELADIATKFGYLG